MRERLFTMRISDQEAEQLQRIAKERKLTAADLIRELLAREARALGIDRSAPPDPSSVFETAQRIWEKAGGRGRGDPRMSGFMVEDGRRLYVLQDRSLVYAIFDVMKSGKLRLQPAPRQR